MYNVCFSRDGRLFATAGKDGLVRICDSRTFDIRRTLATGQGEVNAATFSPDGAALATAGDDGTVRVWDVTTGLEQLKIDAFKKQAYGVAFTRDGNRLITCGKNPVIRVWDRRTGQAVGVLKGHTDDVESIAVSPDGLLLASASGDRSARLWNLESNQELAVIASRPARFSCVAFSPNGKQIANASLNGLVSIWKIASRQDLIKPTLHFDGVHTLAFSPDGSLLATGDRAGAVRIWKVADHRNTTSSGPAHPDNAPLRFWTAHAGRVWSLTFSPDGTQLITAGGDGQVKAWSLESLADDNHLPTSDSLRDFAFLASGDAVTVGKTGVVSWDLATRKRIGEFADSKGDDRISVASDGKGHLVAAGNASGLIRLWNTTTRTPDKEWKSEKETVIQKLAMNSVGKLLAAITIDKLLIFELPTLKLITGFPNGFANVVSFSPDGRQLAFVPTKPDAFSIAIWNVADQQRIRVLSGHQGAIHALAYSPNGRLLATGGDDRLVRVWPLDRKAPPVVLTGHRGVLISAAFSPDGRSLVTIDHENIAAAGRRRTLKVWNIATGDELLSRTDGECKRASLSPNGRSLVVRETSGRIRVIDVSPILPRVLEY